MELNSVLALAITGIVVTYGMYLTITSVARSYFDHRKWEVKDKGVDIILPLRLQAYERMCLFLERITPDHLIMRTTGTAASSLEYQQLLLREIREEYTHNLAQQIYMSHDAWEHVRNAVGEVQTLVNQSATETDPQAASNELAKKIFENVIRQDAQPTAKALRVLKSDIQALF